MEANDILVVEPPDTRPELGLGHCRDLVYHQAARQAQAIVPVGLYEQSNERRVGLIGGEAHTVIEAVESKLSSCTMATGGGFPA
jgi:hypothetical protein